jgi:Biopolymer transport protein ExbD/TolR
MARAEREDALVVAIMRTGDVFFGNDKFSAGSLSDALRERLHSTRERKVYIRADARVHWATVGLVLDEVRAAGIAEVAFLADQRKEAAVPFKPPGSWGGPVSWIWVGVERDSSAALGFGMTRFWDSVAEQLLFIDVQQTYPLVAPGTSRQLCPVPIILSFRRRTRRRNLRHHESAFWRTFASASNSGGKSATRTPSRTGLYRSFPSEHPSQATLTFVHESKARCPQQQPTLNLTYSADSASPVTRPT